MSKEAVTLRKGGCNPVYGGQPRVSTAVPYVRTRARGAPLTYVRQKEAHSSSPAPLANVHVRRRNAASSAARGATSCLSTPAACCWAHSSASWRRRSSAERRCCSSGAVRDGGT